VMVRFGGGPQTPEEHAHFGTIDALTGYAACVALGAALERRRITGEGGVARAALAGCGGMIQAQFMYDFEERGPFDEPSGPLAQGWGAFYHCYRAADGWMFFAAPTERAAALRRVPDLADLAEMPEAGLADALATRFAFNTIAEWAALFAGGSAAIVPLGSLAGNLDAGLQYESSDEIDIQKSTFRAIRHDRHPMGRWVDLVAPNAVRPANAPITIPNAAPKPGTQTRKVLAALGFTEAEVDAMIASGAAGEAWSEKYLPE